MLRSIYGWSKNSGEPSIYVHLSGDTVRKALLEKAGVQQKAGAEPKVITCPRCKCPNEPSATICVRCKSVLRLQDAVSISTVRKELEEQGQQLSSLASQVSGLTCEMKLRIRSDFQTSEVIETKSVRKLRDEGFVLEK